MIECLLQQSGFSFQFDSSNQWIIAFLEVSILGAIVVAVAVAAEHLLRRKVSNKFLYALWMLVLIRFVLIWAPESPTSFLNSIQTKAEPLSDVAAAEDFAVPVSAYPIAAVAPSTPAEESIVEPFVAAIAAAPAFQERGINWLYVAMVVWLCGCAFLIARLCVGWIKLRQTIARSVDASIAAPLLSDLCREVNTESQIRSKVRVLVTDSLSTPATTGFLHPVILIPQRCVTELNVEAMRLVLAHELVHIRRCDGVFQLLAWAIQTLHWFNPFVHLAVRKIADHRELSCDQAVLNTLNGKLKTLYGQTILKLTELESINNRAPAVLAHGFIGSNRKLITQRIDMIANPKSTRWLGTFMGSILVLAILAIGYTAAQTQEAQTQAQTADEGDRDSSSSAVKVYKRNSAWPKPFSVTKKWNFAKGIHPDASTGEWPEEMPPELVLAPRFLDPTFVEEPPVEKKPRSLVVPFARESWSAIRKKAIRENTTYSRPFAKGETLKPSEVSIPSRIPLKLTAGTERKLRFDKRIPELTFSKQEVLELTPLAPRELLFVGKKPGISNVRLTYEDGSEESIEVTVDHDVTDVKKAFAKQFPNEQVFIIAKNAELTLVGSVHDKTKAGEMIKFVESFTQAMVNTDNFGSLVAWKIQIYEFSLEKFRNLGITNPTDKKIEINKLSQLFFQKKGLGSPEVHIGVRPDKQHEATIETFLQHNVAKLMDQPWLISNSSGMTQFFVGAQHTGGVITMPPIPADPEWDPARPLDSFELMAHQMTPEGLTLEINIKYSGMRDVGVDGKIERRLEQRKIQTGFRLKFGETVMVIQEPSDEESGDKATMTLITPTMPK